MVDLCSDFLSHSLNLDFTSDILAEIASAGSMLRASRLESWGV